MRRLKKIRQAAGYSLRDLAQISGLGVSTIGNFETGKTNMSAEKIGRLAKFLKTDAEEISAEDTLENACQAHDAAADTAKGLRSLLMAEIEAWVGCFGYSEKKEFDEHLKRINSRLLEHYNWSRENFQTARKAALEAVRAQYGISP